MILIPKVCGLCNGAKGCISAAYKIKEQNNHNKVVIYKEILHNPKVIEQMNNDGIKIIDSLDGISDEIVVIRGHGEPQSTFLYLEQHNINYYDATCPNVQKIQRIISEHYNDGYKIVIVGKRNHPEVIGLNGWANNKAIVISSLDEVKMISDKIAGKLLLVSQTTFNSYELNKIVEGIKKINPSVEFYNTVCCAQKNIQESSKEIAALCDAMIVIGGKNSSNTHELWSICNEICPSFLFESSDEIEEWIKNVDVKQWKNIGITGGASTPKEEILLVKCIIKTAQKGNNIKKKAML